MEGKNEEMGDATLHYRSRRVTRSERTRVAAAEAIRQVYHRYPKDPAIDVVLALARLAFRDEAWRTKRREGRRARMRMRDLFTRASKIKKRA